jgi:DNA modification methylase
MIKIKIDPEFRDLIPPLSADELRMLEASIASEGRAVTPLIVWQGTLVDGHNRHAICTRLGLPFETEQLNGDRTRSDIKVWIIEHQLARRNISQFERARLALRLEDELKAQGLERKRDAGRTHGLGREVFHNYEKPHLHPHNTLQSVAQAAGVSHNQVHRVKKIEEAARDGRLDTTTVDKLRSGDTTINKVFSELRKEERRVALRQREADLRSKAEQSTDKSVVIRAGDCLDLIDQLEDGSVHLLLTDPPYFVTENEWDQWDSEEDFLTFMREWLTRMRPKMAEQHTAFVFCDADRTAQTWQVLRFAGFEVMRQAIWYRPALAKKRSGSKTFLSAYEPFWHCGTRALFLPDEWGNERFDVQIFNAPTSTTPADLSMHPTQKPLDLFSRLVSLGSTIGELVVDPFMGSGTTALACISQDRRVIGFDKSEEYVRLALGRCAESQQEVAHAK